MRAPLREAPRNGRHADASTRSKSTLRRAASTPLQAGRAQLALIFDAACARAAGAGAVSQPAALMSVRSFLGFMSEAHVVPQLLSPAEVAAGVVAMDRRGISLNEFIERLRVTAELAFGADRRVTAAARQQALLEFIAPACAAVYGVELPLGMPSPPHAASPVGTYRPSAALLPEASPEPPPARQRQRQHASPPSPQPQEQRRGPSGGAAKLHELHERLAEAERDLRSERREKAAIALHADRACAAMEAELERLRRESVSNRQQEQALRALSPRRSGARGRRHGRDVLGALAVGIISRSRVSATAGWFEVWVARVREGMLQRAVATERRRADAALAGAEDALVSITLREEQQHHQQIEQQAPSRLAGRHRDMDALGLSPAVTARRSGGASAAATATTAPKTHRGLTLAAKDEKHAELSLAVSAAKVEGEAWRRRAEGEATTRAAAEREFEKERAAAAEALAGALSRAEEQANAQIKAAKQEAEVEWMEREGELFVQAQAAATQAAEAVTSAPSQVVSALQGAASELRQELRGAEAETDRYFQILGSVSSLGVRRWLLWRVLSRWRSLAFIVGHETTAAQSKVVLVVLLLHQRRRQQLRLRAFQCWRQWVATLWTG